MSQTPISTRLEKRRSPRRSLSSNRRGVPLSSSDIDLLPCRLRTRFLFLKEGHVAMFGQREEVLNALQARSADRFRTRNESGPRVGRLISAGNGRSQWQTGRRIVISHVEKFAPNEQRCSQMLPTSCAIRIEIDRLRCESRYCSASLLICHLKAMAVSRPAARCLWRARGCPQAGSPSGSDGRPPSGGRAVVHEPSFAGRERAPAVSGKSRVPSVPFNDASHSLKPNICVPARLGKALILIFVLVFGGWGYFAPLDGGAVAPGVINPDSGKKTIQHLGIIAEMRVREGEAVTIGQPLVVLESTQARAAHDSLVQQRWSLLARKARLEAESAEQDRSSGLQSCSRRIGKSKALSRRSGGLRRAAVDFSTKKRPRPADRTIDATDQWQRSPSRKRVAPDRVYFRGIAGEGVSGRTRSGTEAGALRLRRVDAEISGKRGNILPRLRGCASRSAKPNCKSSLSTRSGRTRSPPMRRRAARI